MRSCNISNNDISNDLLYKLFIQFKGIKFMWDATVESVEMLKSRPGSGCILAHCMGLGKTLQVRHNILDNE